MKITDIRIGNLITYQDENETTEPIIIKVGVSDIVLMNENFKSVKYEPIELTEDWLVKVGFDKKGDGEYYLSYYTIVIDDEITLWQGYCRLCVFKYLHQLQNLYFSLTGEELNYENI